MTKRQNMPALQLQLSEAELERLSYERYAFPCVMIQKRIFAVYLKATTSFSYEAIGLVCGLHYNTVAHWCKVYNQKGYEGLLTNGYGTNHSELEAHQKDLLSFFEQQPPRSAAEAQEYIDEHYGIRRSLQQVRTFLKGHGLSYRKCGHVPAKADSEQQQHWVEEKLQPAIEAARKAKVHLLFLDTAHFVPGSFLCSLWCVVRVFVKAASGRNRINVLGAVDAISKKVVTSCNTTYITAETIMEFLRLLKKKFRGKPLVIVLDNARYQHCRAVKELATGLKITLLFLPPYSPNLNLIERLWRFTKKQILYGRYYDKPAAFHQAIETFFKNINKQHKKQLKSLLTLNFQSFYNKNSLIYPL